MGIHSSQLHDPIDVRHHHPKPIDLPWLRERLTNRLAAVNCHAEERSSRRPPTDRAVPVLAAIGDQIGARGAAFSRALGAYPRYYEYNDGDLLRSDAELIYEATVARWKLGGRNRAAAEFVLRYRAADPNPMHRAGATGALARLGLN